MASDISTSPHSPVTSIEGVVDFLKAHSLTLTTAESCTAGQICSSIADISGCGSVLHNGYVVYSELAKQHCLGVSAATIAEFGLTSEEVAQEMALGALRAGMANLAVAVTGTAESDDELDGIVCFAYAVKTGDDCQTISETVHFEGSRNEVRQSAAQHAILRLPQVCVQLLPQSDNEMNSE